jgi:hypothetical protein
MLFGMRNPILPSPDRPIPLPDCILMDSWWADRRAELRGGMRSELRLVVSEREEGPDDRSHQVARRTD